MDDPSWPWYWAFTKLAVQRLLEDQFGRDSVVVEIQGNILTATTTHLKADWIRRNGVPRSDRATLTEHWIRHGNYLTLISIVNDPVYLTEPFIRTTNFDLDTEQKIDPFPCESVVEVAHPDGYVPHHLPGTNPFLADFAAKYELPQEATRGGAETMYPEYQLGLAKFSTAAR